MSHYTMKDADMLSMLGDGKFFICSFCGGKETEIGEWHGANAHLTCCQKCAKDILPILIADSLRMYQLEQVPRAEQFFESLKAPFWRALYVRVNR